MFLLPTHIAPKMVNENKFFKQKTFPDFYKELKKNDKKTR